MRHLALHWPSGEFFLHCFRTSPITKDKTGVPPAIVVTQKLILMFLPPRWDLYYLLPPA